MRNLIQNLSENPDLGTLFVMALFSSINNDTRGAILSVKLLSKGRSD